MTRIHKIKSSALYHVIFVGVLTAISLSSLTLLFFNQKKIKLLTELESKLMYNALSGVEYFKVYHNSLEWNKKEGISMFQSTIDSVYLTKRKWGIYTLLNSLATHKKTQINVNCLLGHEIHQGTESLYLSDKGRPLNVSGETRIEGTVSLPKSGIKRAYIDGENYRGGQLVYGERKVSDNSLPNISSIDEFLSERSVKNSVISSTTNQTVFNSFNNETLFFEINGQGINDYNFRGNIVVFSKDSVIIEPNYALEDVIIFSPKVIVKSGFVGSVQIFAKDEIFLERDVVLKYPSALILEEEDYENFKSKSITISERSQVLGTIVLFSHQPNFRKPLILNIKSKALISGFVYNSGSTELQGDILGHLFTDKFKLKTRSSRYENHILNGKIRSGLPNEFGTINLSGDNSKLIDIKWVD